MATQICPACKADAFTWYIDEEDHPLTRWRCYVCGYTALENELLERECANCKTKNESWLEDVNKKYWWCSRCNNITASEEPYKQ